MNYVAHLICHTHWDREWYFTKEQFRTKLVRLIDELLDIIETQPDYLSFMLDGQTIAIEDYLEIKPYNRGRLFAALKSGKIICGPWYVLPDELLISGEAHIRNYLLGSYVLKGAGSAMKTAYLPDSFGHPSQMPQIVAGLGMDTMVFWRGVPHSVQQTEFYWQAPRQNAKILCVHMPHGYGNCGNLSEDIEETSARVNALAQSLHEKSSADVLLLMNGSDHITGQKNIVRIVEKLNKALDGGEVRLSTMEAFLRDLKAGLGNLKTHSGELRSGDRAFLLGGTLSTRMELKQYNEQVQTAMERYLEPLLCCELMLGKRPDTKGYVNYMWRRILENHPHDSICGCSIDAVHEEMEARYKSLILLQNTFLGDTFSRLEGLMCEKGAKGGVSLLLFEPTQDSLPAYVEATLDFDRMLVQEVNFSKSIIEDYEAQIQHPDFSEGFLIRDEAGRVIPFVVLEQKKAYGTWYQDHTMPEIYKSNRVRVAMLLPGFTFGLHTLIVEKSYKQTEGIVTDDSNFIENRFYKLSFASGSFTLENKVTSEVHENVHSFIDKGDAGDEYTYSWPQNNKIYTLSKEGAELKRELLFGIGERLIVKAELLLPKGLTGDRKSRSNELVACPVTVTATLLRGVNRIDFKTMLLNRARDHRLQVQFPTGQNVSATESFNTFNIEERAVDMVIPESWAEYPQNTHPTHGYVYAGNETAGLCLGTKGLPEFEAVRGEKQTKVNLTLLRSVGWLSRTDLLTRRGNGGWTIETPNAQGLREYQFEYGVSYFCGGEEREEAFALMQNAFLPPACHQLYSGLSWARHSKNALAFLSDLPHAIRLSTVKPAEDGGWHCRQAF